MDSITVTPDILLAAARRLPTSPRVFSALETALRHPDVSIDSSVDIVKVDPSLAARVIRAANSPIFRRGAAVEDLDTAIGRIGLREIHRLVGAAVADQLFSVGLPLYRISGDAVWLNALATAFAAEQLAMAAGRESREAYTLGLLRNAGRMLLQRIGQEAALPPTIGAKATGVATRDWELATFGLAADEAGAELLALWEFADATVNGLRWAWSPAGDPTKRMEPALLHTAGWVAVELGYGLAVETDFWALDAAHLRSIGIDRDRAEAVVQPTGEIVARAIEALRPSVAAAG